VTLGKSLRAAGILVTVLGSLLVAPPALAAEQPKTPQEVADYFADDLIPRLIDLYGSGDGVTKGIDFDATTSVGTISRVLAWTPDFLAGTAVETPTMLTNTWVAPVSLRGAVLGLASVWINPADDEPELAEFDPPELANRLATAPPKSLLVHDPARDAWFAIDGDTLTPLVPGSSGATRQTTPEAYQRTITAVSPAAAASEPPGVAIAALVLGFVVLVLAVFVLLPVRRRAEPDAEDDFDGEA
jgi:hypothetical protein